MFLYEEMLDKLLNNKINYLGIAANMLCIGIGDSIDVINRKGNLVIKSEISIHIQCPWRIICKNNNKVVLSSYDIDSSNDLTNNNYNDGITNSFARKSTEWLDNDNEKIISDYSVNSLGDLKLVLNNGEIFETFIDNCKNLECWRVFETNSNKKHLVMSGAGMEYE